jgi:hypothetical protein
MISVISKKLITIFQNLKILFDETDIRILVFFPPALAFGTYLVLFFATKYVLEKPVSEAWNYIELGLACLVVCISGIAEIYKKEAPGTVGKTIKGNKAIVSGISIFNFLWIRWACFVSV